MKWFVFLIFADHYIYRSISFVALFFILNVPRVELVTFLTKGSVLKILIMLKREREHRWNSFVFTGAATALSKSICQSESPAHGREGWSRRDDIPAYMLHGGQFRRGVLWYFSQRWGNGVRGASRVRSRGCDSGRHFSRLDQIRRPEEGLRRKGEWVSERVVALAIDTNCWRSRFTRVWRSNFLFLVESEHENGAADDVRAFLRRGLAENRVRANEGTTW